MNKAASLSFYTIISVFPMMLMVAAFFGRFGTESVVLEKLLKILDETLPYQSQLLQQNISSLFTKTPSFSYFSLIALIISAQMLYVNFGKVVNSLLHTSKKRHFILTRMFFLIWIGGVIVVLFSPVFFEFLTLWLTKVGFPIFSAELFRKGGFFVMGFLVFVLVMLVLPTNRVSAKRLMQGGLIFAMVLQIGKFVFKWTTFRQAERYNFVYGSLSSMVLILMWVFYFYNMFLFCVYWIGRERDPNYLESHPPKRVKTS